MAGWNLVFLQQELNLPEVLGPQNLDDVRTGELEGHVQWRVLRVQLVGKSQSCMISKLPIIFQRTRTEEESSRRPAPTRLSETEPKIIVYLPGLTARGVA